jgi:hypothetical protein
MNADQINAINLAFDTLKKVFHEVGFYENCRDSKYSEENYKDLDNAIHALFDANVPQNIIDHFKQCI